jgi:hypothetical protein
MWRLKVDKLDAALRSAAPPASVSAFSSKRSVEAGRHVGRERVCLRERERERGKSCLVTN